MLISHYVRVYTYLCEQKSCLFIDIHIAFLGLLSFATSVHLVTSNSIVASFEGVHRVTVQPSPPVVVLSTSAVTVTDADSVTLSADGSYSPDDRSVTLQYHWSCERVRRGIAS